jgi:hypothetical protein
LALRPLNRARTSLRAYAGALALLVVAAGSLLATPSGAAAAAPRSVVIAIHPGGGVAGEGRIRIPTVFERLAERPALALGLMGATQGAYDRRQALLDLTAGNRVSRSGYEPRDVPRYGIRPTTGGWEVSQWQQILSRARTAPTDIVPGLLAGSVPGGGAYVSAATTPAADAVLAADETGAIGEVSLGPRSTLLERLDGVLERRRLAILPLPRGDRGDRALDELLRRRPPSQLVLVIRRPPRSDVHQMLSFGAAGLSGGGLLTSRTTRRLGLVAATDVVPTVFGWLGVPVPSVVAGRPIVAVGERDVEALAALESRLRAVYPRRFPALFAVFASLALTAALLSAFGGRDGRRRALRVCALAVLWIPFVALLPSAIEPTRNAELALMGLGTVVLALISDRLAPWPRAPLLPALAAIPAYVVDLALGSDLIVRSLLGPNPRFGSRFYGIGNELEATLPVLLLLGLAALAGRAPRSRRLAVLFAVPLLTLGAAVGAGRLGADVGGVITVGAAAAAAVVMALPGRVSRRTVLVALSVPALAVVALAAIDLLTGGDAHFTNTVLRAESAQALGETIVRRYELAWQALVRGAMPLLTLAAVAAAIFAWRRRASLYAPVADRPAWGAALVGGLAGSTAGALTNDSGPVLLVIGVFVLAWATAYIQGDPRLAPARAPREPVPAPKPVAGAVGVGD